MLQADTSGELIAFVALESGEMSDDADDRTGEFGCC